MSTKLGGSAEKLILALKDSLDALSEKVGGRAVLESLTYADKEYGLMQRAELREIIQQLEGLKQQVDRLAEDCRSIPAVARGSAENGPDEAPGSEPLREAGSAKGGGG